MPLPPELDTIPAAARRCAVLRLRGGASQMLFVVDESGDRLVLPMLPSISFARENLGSQHLNVCLGTSE